MALPVVISRNQIQKTNKRMIPLTNDVVQPTTWYTCPTSKVAIVKGTCVFLVQGASTTMDLEINGVSVAEWKFDGTNVDINFPVDLKLGVIFPFEANLNAEDTIITTQSSGTNAQVKFQAVIEEFNI